jgi:hypothetical protein
MIFFPQTLLGLDRNFGLSSGFQKTHQKNKILDFKL